MGPNVGTPKNQCDNFAAGEFEQDSKAEGNKRFSLNFKGSCKIYKFETNHSKQHFKKITFLYLKIAFFTPEDAQGVECFQVQKKNVLIFFCFYPKQLS